jgi:aminopeptidase-like protein
MVSLHAKNEESQSLLERLFPINRSITGNGVRETLNIISKSIPINIVEVKSGTKVFDWTVPPEWNIKEAYIKDSKGNKIVDFQDSNLSVVGYSTPENITLSLKELKEHLYTLKEYPDWIPYRTSYYNRNWGFCMKYKKYRTLKDGQYKVYINSSLKKGSLSYGELFIKGRTKKEILISTYLCHPSLANDNLSGVVMTVGLAKKILRNDNYYSYRFLFIPETIGAITWLSRNEKILKNILFGLVVTCVGDKKSTFTYKKTKRGDTEIDKAVEKVLADMNKRYQTLKFFPTGSDERQYSSLGINLQVGSLSRTIYGHFKEQHTSADNLNFISAKSVDETLEVHVKVLDVLENNKCYKNLSPKCEPQLGKRGLYRSIGAKTEDKVDERALLWVLNYSDGSTPLLDIAIESKIGFSDIKKAADLLSNVHLLAEVGRKILNH